MMFLFNWAIFLVPHGCFLKWWYPQNTPKWSFFAGKPTVVGYHHFRKHPHSFSGVYITTVNCYYIGFPTATFAPGPWARWRLGFVVGGVTVVGFPIIFWLVVSTHLKNISQNGNLPQVGVKIKNVWNHHLVFQSCHLRMICWLWSFVCIQAGGDKFTSIFIDFR